VVEIPEELNGIVPALHDMVKTALAEVARSPFTRPGKSGRGVDP
jgi:hypothetical protein